jgi:AhpC/TSA family
MMKLIVHVVVAISISPSIALQTPSQQSLSNRRVFLQNVPSIVTGTTAALIGTTTVSINPLIVHATDSTPPTSTVVTATPGEKAPSFTLPNSRGEGTTSLEQLVQSNKWTVLYFYPGAFSKGNAFF